MTFKCFWFCLVLQIGISWSFHINSPLQAPPNDDSKNSLLGDIDHDDNNSGRDGHIGFRIHDYCSFTKLEKNIEPLPDPEECNRINEHFKVNENFNFINYFGHAFDLLNKSVDSLSLPSSKFKMNTVFFIGITGAGKSTLVQILGGDNRKIYAQPVTGDKSEFIIVDNSKIGKNTIVSETICPDIIVDKETDYIIVDNPGFQDTRSPVHELIAMYSMRKVLELTKKFKIVMVTAHPSVKIGAYRTDFIDLLKHSTNFFNDVEKYKNSFYLIANKVENTVEFESVDTQPRRDAESPLLLNNNNNNKFTIVPDYNITEDIGHFLETIKTSLRNKIGTALSNPEKVNKAIKIIDVLLEKNGANYKRINIFRKPMEGGPISDNVILQRERNGIRHNLLNDDNMIDVNNNDFGFALSSSAVLYLNDLFQKMNSYITDLSELVGIYIKTYYRTLMNSKTDINEITSVLTDMKTNIKLLTRDIGNTENPKQYINVISKFSEKNKLKLDCLTNFKNISTLNEYLSNLENYVNADKYSPLLWSASIEKVSDFIDEKLKKYQLLQNVYGYLNTYDIQKIRKSYGKVKEKVNALYNIDLNNYDLAQENYNADVDFMNKVEAVMKTNVRHHPNVFCDGNVLTVIDYIVLISELNDNYLSECDASKIVILAMHTIYIDENMDSDLLKGKDLTVIAPIWDIKGSRKISIDGLSGGDPLPKAGIGEIGKYGRNGKAGGKFYGIGMIFRTGENLVISASGGDGQDGQEGGDGVDGREGSEASNSPKQLVDEAGITFQGFGLKEKTYMAEGGGGSVGGDAGAGGIGGTGGKRGSVIIHNIGEEEHGITVVTVNGKPGKTGKDGIPGKGGVKGCDEIIKKRTISAFGFQLDLNSEREQVNCKSRNEDGKVHKLAQQPTEVTENRYNNDSPVCVHIMTFQNYYLKELHHLLTDGLTKRFITEMKLTKY